ncbi:response regulator transcription factor [Candidatus Sulfurimonas marisnigri]|uniref:Response regulator transcription factor n=1 Tax=Candidatus Sulfurimonas marisnigri TaxID=2740405 RepID=A0A7S7RRB6_9BACT|nr:response regulator transcription factor [Candidatus Sulfurimonas marisnigri]QOY55559.1 response regulator transcription factor [Candidatus Sulfurimonas marisnigri]
MLNSKELLVYTKDLSILFVEDIEDLRANTSEILKNFFKKVDTAINGEDALIKYKDYYNETSNYYDIILSDIQMPRLNGVELVANIYNINASQKVIILSAYDDSKYLLPLINLGIEQFIKKPIDYQNLLQALLSASKNLNKTKNTNKNSNINLDSSFMFNKENSLLINHGTIIPLTKYEIIFLQILSQDVGKIYSNEAITSHYNSFNESLDTSNIRKLVSKLRKKLPENCVESIYGIGYRLTPYLDI